jgi:antitoxin component YwqK of YwqJK toxin-antitoxin module
MNETPKFWVRLKLKIQYYNNKLDTWVEDCWDKLRLIFIQCVPLICTICFFAVISSIYQKTDWVIQFNEVSYLQNRDGFVYEVNSDSKFTGSYVVTYGKESECTGVSCLSGKEQIKTKIIYRDGVKSGGYTFWYENGKKMEEKNYKNGVMDGVWIKWFRNGQKEREGNFKDGRLDGLFTLWYENGKKRKEEKWKNGDLVK